MDLSKALSLYEKGQALLKECEEACHFGSGILNIDFMNGYIQLSSEEFKRIVKDPREIISASGEYPVFGILWEHSIVINGVKFITLSEKEDIYGD